MPDTPSGYHCRPCDHQHRRASGGALARHRVSVDRQPFDYTHPVYLAAAAEAKRQTSGHCRKCGRKVPLEAHHWARGPYPPAHLTTANDLSAFCADCHDEEHEVRSFCDAGGSLEEYRASRSETRAALLLRPGTVRRSLMRWGRAVTSNGQWAAIVNGRAKPRYGEVFLLYLRSLDAWRVAIVTDVLNGRQGHWCVTKRFLGAGDDLRPMMCVNAVRAEAGDAPGRGRCASTPSARRQAMRQVAA